MNIKNRQAGAILFVDDEDMSNKWFKKTFEEDYTVYSANSADMALTMMDLFGDEVAVVISDFRMPAKDGLELLRTLNQTHPWIIKILVSAYADKDLVMQALNQQLVFRVLEKPWDDKAMQRAVKDAFAAYHGALTAREHMENSIGGMRDSLTFVAQEFNAPLNVIGSCLNMIQSTLAEVDTNNQLPHHLTSVLPALEASHRNLIRCQKLMAGFMQSTHAAFADTEKSPIQAARLVQLLCAETSPPIQTAKDWIRLDIQDDFYIETKQNLVYLCLLNILQNSVQALHNHASRPSIQITIKNSQAPTPLLGHSICISDNGPGIAPNALARILSNRIPAPKEMADNHSGTGLMFCKKIMLSLNGNISIQSNTRGTSVTLHFPFNKKDTV